MLTVIINLTKVSRNTEFLIGTQTLSRAIHVDQIKHYPTPTNYSVIEFMERMEMQTFQVKVVNRSNYTQYESL